MKKLFLIFLFISGFASAQKEFSISNFTMITQLTKPQLEAKYEIKPSKESKDAKGNKTVTYLVSENIQDKKVNYILTISPDKDGNIVKSQLFNDEEIRHELFGNMSYLSSKGKLPNCKWTYIDENKVEIPYFSMNEFSNAITSEHSKVGTYSISFSIGGTTIDYRLSPKSLSIFNTRVLK